MGFCFLITVFWRVEYFLTYKGFFCQSFDHEELVDLGGFLKQILNLRTSLLHCQVTKFSITLSTASRRILQSSMFLYQDCLEDLVQNEN